MKKLLFISLLLIATMGLHAQKNHFGVKAGITLSSLNTEDKDWENGAKSKTNFMFGLTSEFRISDKFAIAPELNYTGSGGVSDDGIGKHEIRLSYLNIPVMARYYVSKNISLEGGLGLGVLLSAEDYEAEYIDNNELDSDAKPYDIKDLCNSTNFNLGIGANYHLNDKIFINARYNIGLSNVYKDGVLEFKNGVAKINVIEIGVGYFFN